MKRSKDRLKNLNAYRRKARLMKKSSARQTAKATIDGIEWFCHINATLRLKINIQRKLINIVAKHTGDIIDAGNAIAVYATQHINRLEENGYSFGQSEGLIQKPFKATLHILVMDKEVYVADQEFYPYPA